MLSVDDVRALEQLSVANGTSLLALMMRAGSALASAVQEELPDGGKVLVVCGSGNNGGDGWVCADQLAGMGYTVTLAVPRGAHAITAQPAFQAANMVAGVASRGSMNLEFLINPFLDDLTAAAAESDVIVDCILGTGFADTSVRAPYSDWIETINKAHAAGVKVIAADVPSGLNAQTGIPAYPCVEADKTVTMIAAKSGFSMAMARRFTGELYVAYLGVDTKTRE